MYLLATRILVILTLALGAAGLRSMHVASAHVTVSTSSHGSHDCEHQHLDNSHHDHECEDADADCDGHACHDEQTCETCVTLLALAFQTLDIPALVPTERVAETLTIAPTVTPADIAIDANRARPPPNA